ncbi:hypothetical protein A9B99_00500 [Mangrovibacter phragmitis]|uniref:GrpB family protein n=1 Tax=Mangrovibacter phragmitis TaxID=1691903 RepID=A0A1B7L7J4_9ENTR|nr:GrpB family protein [Mangrovibacter phragmitis]OAT78256.1 hypothetical protein A9B99_00500 [Mangrovibacter phragmitis]
MRTITVVAYDPRWPEMFTAESQLLQQVLPGGIAKAIHHIGSTSVPGLAAKPVIDILLEVPNLAELDACNTQMQQAGYIARGENGIAGRRYFVKGGEQRSHQVHAFVTGDEQITKHVAFRDYLLTNQQATEQYASVKYAAAQACNNDSQRYCELKAGFIEHHLQLAMLCRKW